MKKQEKTKRNRERTPNNRTTTGFRISDELWAVLEPMLPIHVNTHHFGGGRPRVPDRDCADAIFYVLRTGCQWQALDQTELCPHSTAHDRFQEWVQAGVFLRLWQAGLEQFEELRGIDWDWLSMDGAMTKAPLGGEKTGPNPTDRGKSGVKRSVLIEGHGVPIGLTVEGANRTDMKLVRRTLESIVIDRPKPTEEHPQGMCLDKGYDYGEVRDTRLYRPYPQAWGRSQSHQEGSGFQSTKVGRGAGSFVDESLSPFAGSLGQKPCQLRGFSPFRLCLDRFPVRRVIRIGS